MINFGKKNEYISHRAENCCGGCIAWLFVILGITYVIFKFIEIAGTNVDFQVKNVAIPPGLFAKKAFKFPEDSLNFCFGV